MTPEPAADVRGSIAAVVGGLALVAAMVPVLPTTARWSVVIGAGAVAVLVGLTALRRRQLLRTALLSVAGMLAPVVAAAVVVVTPNVAPLVENRLLPAGSPFSTSSTARTSASLARYPVSERDAASAAATAMAVHLRAMHGVGGPFPLQLAGTAGTLVEHVGTIGDVVVGTVPYGMHVRYAVAPDQRFYEVRVELDGDPDAAATADSTVQLPDAG